MALEALSDIRALDFTHYVAGPYCAKLLADYGAEVLKVERPGAGDGSRALGPFPDDEPHHEKSGLFLHLNTNKRSVTLNLKTSAAVGIVKKLVEQSDVVVESFRPGTMERLGLGFDALTAINPKLVMTSISNFGQSGPYRDFRGSDAIFYAMGGEMYSTGIDEREPVKIADSVVLYQAGAVASVATMGALFAARRTGAGQHVDVSILETQMGSIDRRMSMLLAYQYTGETSGRRPLESTGGYPQGVYPCKDGYLEITGGGSYFPRVVRMLGEPDFLKDPKWHAPESQHDPELKAEFDGYFYPWILSRTKQEAWQAAQQARVISAPMNTMEDLNDDANFADRGAFAEVEHPEAGRLRYPGRPFIMDATPWSIRRPAPLLGQHTEETLTALGYGADDIARLRESGVV